MQLKATKTSLYKLVPEHEPLPPMKKTEFFKAFRCPAYWLKWRADDVSYTAYLSACAGTPILAIEAVEYDEESGRHKTVSRVTHRVAVDDLRRRGMVDDRT